MCVRVPRVQELGGRLWRNRQAAAAALADLLQVGGGLNAVNNSICKALLKCSRSEDAGGCLWAFKV